ncbi:MAG: SDR family NAD(P)-dependent oxidoreductase [Pseudomonadales bacterium]|nr:SDR family NAD(P)-dependent oxidoreductase [Pseudomonadales bacterium]
MILVTGATGRIGLRVVERLVDANQRVRVFVRSKEKAQRLLSSHVEIIEGDLSDADVVRDAVESVNSIMLLSPVNPEQVTLQGNVVVAAAAGSRPHMVKVSGLGTALDSFIDSGRWHAQTEQQIVSAGLSYTFLRPLFFMQNLSFLFDSARRLGLICAGVENAKIAMIDVQDIAEVATRILINPALMMNQSAALTSLESVSYQTVARTFGEVLGRDVRFEHQSRDDVKKNLMESGQPEWHIKLLLQFNQAFIEGQGDIVNTVAEEILGRAPTSLKKFLRRELNNSSIDEGDNPFPS